MDACAKIPLELIKFDKVGRMGSYFTISLLLVLCPVFISAQCQTFQNLDISRSDSVNFNRNVLDNVSIITISNNLAQRGICIGDVFDGDILISAVPPASGPFERHVRIIEHGDSRTNSVEVFTKNGDLMSRERFKKNADGGEACYQRFDYESIDVDACSEDAERFSSPNMSSNLNQYEKIGAIKCGSDVLIDGVDVYERTFHFSGPGSNVIEVKTIPYIGDEFSTTLVRTKSGKYRPQGEYISLDISKDPAIYSDIAISCGVGCVFFDGSNPSNTIIDVVQGDLVIFDDPLTRSLCVKLEEMDGRSYLTVYNRRLNSEKTGAYFFISREKDTFTKIERRFISLDLGSGGKKDDLIQVECTEHGCDYRITAEGSFTNAIGEIKYNEHKIPANEECIERIVVRHGDLLVVDDVTYTGNFIRTLYKLDHQKLLPHKIKPLMIKIETLVQSTKEIEVTKSYNGFYKLASRVGNKIGTVKCGDVVVLPNRYNNKSVILAHNGYEMIAASNLTDGRFIYQKFSTTSSIYDLGTPIYIQQAKEFVTLDITKFIFNSALDVVDLGNYLKFDVKNVFTHCIGNVSNDGNILLPFDPQLTSRTVYLNKFTYHFIVKSCDVHECITDVYQLQSLNGIVRYSVVDKTPIDISILDDKNSNVLSVVTDGDYKFYRIKQELSFKYKIANVLYNGHVISPDTNLNFTRMVNLYLPKTLEGGKLRILDVERWHKSTKLYNVNFLGEPNNGKSAKDARMTLTRRPPQKIALDIGLRKCEPCISIRRYNSVLEFYINWQSADDYILNEIDITGADGSTKIVQPNINSTSLNVRLHPKGHDLYIAIEKVPEDLPKPSNCDYYPMEYEKDTYGLVLHYNVINLNTLKLDCYQQDLYNRTLYTPFYFKFNTHSEK